VIRAKKEGMTFSHAFLTYNRTEFDIVRAFDVETTSKLRRTAQPRSYSPRQQNPNVPRRYANCINRVIIPQKKN
jgi:hypothetical protein